MEEVEEEEEEEEEEGEEEEKNEEEQEVEKYSIGALPSNIIFHFNKLLCQSSG